MTRFNTMSDRQLFAMLTSLRPSDEAVAILAAALVSDEWYDGVGELRRRYLAQTGHAAPVAQEAQVAEKPQRARSATSVEIDRQRWNDFWFRRRTPLSAVGPMVNRSSGLGSVIGHKGSAGYFTLDELACEIGIRVEDLIFAVGTDAERERVSVCS